MVDFSWYEWLIWLFSFFMAISFWIWSFKENFRKWFQNTNEYDIMEENKQEE